LLQFNPELINLRELIDENISDLRLSSLKKEITMVSVVRKEFPVVADKNMTNAILRNLLNNAIKFTNRSGSIKVNAVNEGDAVVVSVKDTGIGIAEKAIPDLFRIGTKYSRPGTAKEQGTGLGLKICKEFVEMQGGKIRVESKPHSGSEFIFTIPASGSSEKRD